MPSTWLALKILAVGAIFCAGVLLDLLFKPAVDLFSGAGRYAGRHGAQYRRTLESLYARLPLTVLVDLRFSSLIAAALGVF